MNVEVLDEGFGRDVRQRVFENLVGPENASQLTDDAANNFAVLKAVAEANAQVIEWWEDNASSLSAPEAEAVKGDHWPEGFVHPLVLSEDYWWDVGPDLF